MKPLKVGRILGIEVLIHPTFPIFVLILGAMEAAAAGPKAGFVVIGILVALFGFVFLHELGHSLVAIRFRVKVHSITLMPLGGIAATSSMPREPWREIMIALAGPAVNVVLAGIIFVMMGILAIPFNLDAAGAGGTLSYLLVANIMLTLFNLIPAFPLDGGRVFRALLAIRLPYVKATKGAVLIGKLFALAFLIIGLLKPGLMMLGLIAVFLFFSGRRELQGVEYEEWLRNTTIGEFIDSSPWFMAHRDTTVGEVSLAMEQNDGFGYCVVDMEGLRFGILDTKDILSAGLALPPGMAVHRLIEYPRRPLTADAPLMAALPVLQRAPKRRLAVLENLQVTGVVNMLNIDPALVRFRTGNSPKRWWSRG